MAVRSVGSTSTFPRERGDFLGDASGATLDNSWTVQVNFDDTVYTSAREGKQRLINALEMMILFIEAERSWPIGATSI